MIGIEHYLAVAATLLVIGIFGLFLSRKNVIILPDAMIGVIVLTLRHGHCVVRQMMRETADVIEPKNIKPGQGL